MRRYAKHDLRLRPRPWIMVASATRWEPPGPWRYWMWLYQPKRKGGDDA